MDIKKVTADFSVAGQIFTGEIAAIAASGIKTIICNRPDGEGSDQPNMNEVAQMAEDLQLDFVYLPVLSGKVSEEDVSDFHQALEQARKPVLAYCRTGNRSMTLWSLAQGRSGMKASEILSAARSAGYDMSNAVKRMGNYQSPASKAVDERSQQRYDIVIIGGGAAGIAVASSLLSRHKEVSVAIIDPAEVHYYQPGWTMVGGGIFDRQQTVKTMASLIPSGVTWIKAAVAAFEPDNSRVTLENCQPVYYQRLVVAPGIKLDWHGIEGLAENLGQHGVTSNYRFDMAPYTWELVKNLKSGRALFTQPPMPIKCAGAPQKAMYLSADHWYRTNCINNIEIEFYNAGGVLFGVKDYVPALMSYVEKYNAQLKFSHNLTRIDGENRTAWFDRTDTDGKVEQVSREFDMIHVCPPQCAPDFIKSSPLADSAGWVDVDQNTLRHKTFDNIWSLGDVMNAPNAKTAAAARMQAPIVANNVLEDLGLGRGVSHYNGYGSCPLTVERGKIVLAEFGYGGKLLPSFPRWLIDGTQPSYTAWLLKEKLLPPVYWKAMLKGKEWMVKPTKANA
ncbi:bifunctional protein tyrosine phosphatase family protein/NAD(P)/FAD-dependent oxidoreductase [Aestuariirhabdus sp. Z084]|uniref:bifunctional protein tyrosine phosphatase family protein/NAD(P)/FAD-dependent oxidoreductase n=1 Tax=Aestuariirhabdus haliotis TaxID=2918751 RepID=UPI00201B3942|nr:bifunctional protein tyrosine phosphatase family protein/NAD(P)/FAD-dependent oxidoreductase [Aestuariirhabdus haliotis]MCL6417208.1 bifunctional protein tyrosine phosphatase family protein/NAD(P)/FAD-dependent oxidoreductase [Aestuariirhabdus haliotis]MCL6421180.1 bifunctional protein tyrosine phosphatase family protein/NAD(P)/FAD-dependent oxidoreductase [Aestuariirhabdus haliotis]